MKDIKSIVKGNLIDKARRKIRSKWVSRLRKTRVYKYCYKSYWHYLFTRKRNEDSTSDLSNCYFAARPNPGAGIGHQMANWIAGYWFAKKFNLKFAHIPFSNDRWEKFLGFYQGEKTVTELKKQGYKVVRLQRFDENNADECERINRIIESYSGKRIVFLAEQDQFYHDQYGVMDDISKKFFNAPARNEDKLIYDFAYYNVALHIRRQVVIETRVIEEDEEQRAKRWTRNEYYEEVLKALVSIDVGKPVRIYVFSTGKPEEFASFKKYGDVRICSDLDEYDSFVHLVYADLLVTSKSSFSYKPALMSKGIKVCPDGFWHGYPDRPDWFIVPADGKMTEQQVMDMGKEIRRKLGEK